jgi:membrane-associated phospholipid phosphatase
VVAIPVGLLGMNYHFVGDVVGGGFVGAVVGAWTAWLCGINGPEVAARPGLSA